MAEQRRTVFLDRDGVLNINRRDHIKTPEEYVPIPGAAVVGTLSINGGETVTARAVDVRARRGFAVTGRAGADAAGSSACAIKAGAIAEPTADVGVGSSCFAATAGAGIGSSCFAATAGAGTGSSCFAATAGAGIGSSFAATAGAGTGSSRFAVTAGERAAGSGFGMADESTLGAIASSRTGWVVVAATVPGVGPCGNV